MTAAIGYEAPVIHQYQGRDFGLTLLGIILGIFMILLTFYYRGGPSSLTPITSIFDRSRGQSTTPPSQPPRGSSGSGRIEEGSAIPGAKSLRVKVENLNLRTCPGFDCQPVATLPLGMPVTDLGQREFAYGLEWYKVRAERYEGWVVRYYLE